MGGGGYSVMYVRCLYFHAQALQACVCVCEDTLKDTVVLVLVCVCMQPPTESSAARETTEQSTTHQPHNNRGALFT